MLILSDDQQSKLDWQLCRAVEKNDVDGIYVAVEAGAAGDSILAVRAGAMNMLAWACLTSSMKAADTLMDLGVDVNGGRGLSPLVAAVISHAKSDLIDRLIDAGADVDATGAQERTPLIYAVLHNNERAMVTLIGAGADVALEDSSGKSAVDYAVELGHGRITDILQGVVHEIPRRHLSI